MVSKVTHDSKRDSFLLKYVIRESRRTSIECELHTPGDMIVILLLLLLLVMSNSFVTLWPCQAPLSVGFSWQEYWSGLLFPSLGDLPDTGIKPISLVLQQNLYCWVTKEVCIIVNSLILKFSMWLCRRMSLCVWDAYYTVWGGRALYRKIILRWFG